VDGRSRDSRAEDDRPIGVRPYLDRAVGNPLPRRIPRPHDPRHAHHRGNGYQFPSQPRPERSHGTASPMERTAAGQPPAWRQATEDLEATETMDLSGSGLGPWEAQQQAAPGPSQQPSGWLDEEPRPGRHARRAEPQEPGTNERRRRLALQAAYVVALAMASYLLLGGLGLVALPFNPASLIPGGGPPGSEHPAPSPGPAQTVTEPGAGPLTEESEPANAPMTTVPEASSPVPTPTSSAPSTPTAGPTPSATASPTPTPKNHKPTAPPGQTKKPTTPPPP
jgi:hypothetical protein